MKATIVVLGLLAIAAAIAACGGSSSKTSTTPAASSAAPTSSSATKASGGATAAAPTSTAAAASGSGSGACKYMSDGDAATLLSSAGQATVKTADTPAGKITTCVWGAQLGQTNRIVLLVSELKIDVAVEAAKKAASTELKEKIDGLGDTGGFTEKGSDSVGILFIKGKTTALLTVASTGVNADAVAAVAKKIPAKL
jgi:hypothetical protein